MSRLEWSLVAIHITCLILLWVNYLQEGQISDLEDRIEVVEDLIAIE